MPSFNLKLKCKQILIVYYQHSQLKCLEIVLGPDLEVEIGEITHIDVDPHPERMSEGGTSAGTRMKSGKEVPGDPGQEAENIVPGGKVAETTVVMRVINETILVNGGKMINFRKTQDPAPVTNITEVEREIVDGDHLITDPEMVDRII